MVDSEEKERGREESTSMLKVGKSKKQNDHSLDIVILVKELVGLVPRGVNELKKEAVKPVVHRKRRHSPAPPILKVRRRERVRLKQKEKKKKERGKERRLRRD